MTSGAAAAVPQTKAIVAIVNAWRVIAARSYHSVIAVWIAKRQNAWHVTYWEIIIENLRNAGWNCGSISSTDRNGRQFWVVAAERSDAERFIVEADQELPAFLELESAVDYLKTRRNHQQNTAIPRG